VSCAADHPLRPPCVSITAAAHLLGGGEQARKRLARASGYPTGERRGGTLGGMRGAAGEFEQFADLLGRGALYPCSLRKCRDPLIPGHGPQLNLEAQMTRSLIWTRR